MLDQKKLDIRILLCKINKSELSLSNWSNGVVE